MCNHISMHAAFGADNVAGKQTPHLHSLGAGTSHTGRYHRTCSVGSTTSLGPLSRSQAFTHCLAADDDLMGSKALSGSQLDTVKGI